jgi:hypothetical protein
MSYFRASDLFDSAVSGFHPSDVTFSLDKQYVADCKLRGPGIYFMYFKEELVYIGFYRGSKKNNNVAIARWIKELETISMRGFHVSFNPKSILTLSTCQLLQAYFQNPGKGDSGYLTSQNRLTFAEKNWPELSQDPSQWLCHFTFHWHQKSDQHRTKIEIHQVTNQLKQFFKPTCNG